MPPTKRLSPIPENGEYKKNDDKGVSGKGKSGRRTRTPSISITPGKHGNKNTENVLQEEERLTEEDADKYLDTYVRKYLDRCYRNGSI